MFCKKAIYTLLYIYQSKAVREDNKIEYVMALYRQFGMVSNMVIGLNLDDFAAAEQAGDGVAAMFLSTPIPPSIFKDSDKLNVFIFAALKFTKYEKTIAESS